MTYDPARHHRRSIRLRGYDYSRAGAYAVTVCSERRRLIFGAIANGKVLHNDAGLMVNRWWREAAGHFDAVELDDYVIMPNHFHGIVVIDNDKGGHIGPPLQKHDPRRRTALSAIMQWFKTMTTDEYARQVRNGLWPPFPSRLWQRGYYDRVIRNGDELMAWRQYIAANPSNWGADGENPDALRNDDLELPPHSTRPP